MHRLGSRSLAPVLRQLQQKSSPSPPWSQGGRLAPQWSPMAPPDRDSLLRTAAIMHESYPKLFSELPDLSIYRDDVEFCLQHTPLAGEFRLQGVDAYRRLFEALRVTRRTTVADADLSYRLFVVDDSTIRVRWHAKLWMRLPLPPLIGASSPVRIDGISHYDLDENARVSRHNLECVERLDGHKPVSAQQLVDTPGATLGWACMGSHLDLR